MRWQTSRLGQVLATTFVASLFGLVAAACGSSSDAGSGVFPNAPDGSAALGDGGGIQLGASDAAYDPDAYFFNDPPPQWCGPGPAPATATPGGTAVCPDDKNRQGCACPAEGEERPCWPGPRAQRGIGVCKDGVTKCERHGEVGLAWGACEGAVLPKEGATGKEACDCFSEGEWHLDNIIPCFITNTQTTNGNTVVTKSTFSSSDGTCPQTANPGARFTKNTLKVDCEGTFNLCFQIKAGTYEDPKADDCAFMDPVCTGDHDYPKKGEVVPFPDLKGWVSDSPAKKACAEKFENTGGYGELSVLGKSYLCEAIDNGTSGSKVFQRIKYCAVKCSDSAHPENANLPECLGCRNGATGGF